MKKILLTCLFTVMLVGAFQSAIASHESQLQQIGEGTGLPSFQSNPHPDATLEPGLKNIESAGFYVIDFLKYLLGSIAVFMIIISAGRLIIAVEGIEEQITKEKNTIIYASLGLIMIVVAESVVKEALYGPAGYEGTTLEDIDTAIDFATTGALHIAGIYNFMQYFVASVAMLIVIYNGVRLILEGANQEALENRKKHIGYAMIALMVVGLSELFIKDILFPVPSGDDAVITTSEGVVTVQEPNIDEATALNTIADIGNFIASFIGFLAMAAFVYGGYLYVTSRGEEEQLGTAKKVFFGAIVALLLAAAAFALLSTVIPLEGRESEEVSVPF